MPRRPDLPTREEMEGDPVPELGDGPAVAVAPPKTLGAVVSPPPAKESVPARRDVPTVPVEIPGLPYPKFVEIVLRSYLSGPLGLAAFSGTLLFTECPRLYRKTARLIAQGPWGDIAWGNMTEEEKQALGRGLIQ